LKLDRLGCSRQTGSPHADSTIGLPNQELSCRSPLDQYDVQRVLDSEVSRRGTGQPRRWRIRRVRGLDQKMIFTAESNLYTSYAGIGHPASYNPTLCPLRASPPPRQSQVGPWPTGDSRKEEPCRLTWKRCFRTSVFCAVWRSSSFAACHLLTTTCLWHYGFWHASAKVSNAKTYSCNHPCRDRRL
jgi:hypothetical protein